MVKSLQGGGGDQNLPPDVSQVIDLLEGHCLAPAGSLVSKSTYHDLQLAREEMSRDRLRYLEAMAIYYEAIAMVEGYQQGVLVANLGGVHSQLCLKNSPQVYEMLEHRLVVAEATQRLRLPLISKDGEFLRMRLRNGFHEQHLGGNNAVTVSEADPGFGGVPNCFLRLTPAYLWKTQLQQMPLSMDMAEYQISVCREIEARLKVKCDKLADAFIDDIGSLKVKMIIEAIEREEAALCEDLYSADRKFAEYYNVLEQILGMLIKLLKDLKLQHQHKYDELQKTWLCKRCETMSAKLRVLEHVLLLGTYTQESIPALHKIRKYLVEATEEASVAYNKSANRLLEYQGVDPHFDNIVRQYHDIVKKLKNMQWMIHQVEMDLKRLPDHPSTYMLVHFHFIYSYTLCCLLVSKPLKYRK